METHLSRSPAVPVINLDPTQYRDIYRVPLYRLSNWGFTMEACLLTGQLGKAVSAVFATFPEDVQHTLTFTPKLPGGWAVRARFWQTALKPTLPPRQYHAAMQKIIRWYAHCLRMRQEK